MSPIKLISKYLMYSVSTANEFSSSLYLSVVCNENHVLISLGFHNVARLIYTDYLVMSLYVLDKHSLYEVESQYLSWCLIYNRC